MARRKVLRIPDFSGGYNPDRDETLIEDNQATLARNVVLDEVGSLKVRDGYSPYITGAHTDGLLAVGRWRDPTDPTTFAVLVQDDTGEILEADGGADAFTSLSTGYSTSAGSFVPADDLLFFVDGANRPAQYDGTSFYNLGIDKPGSAPSVSISATGGTLSGDFTYKYTYYDSSTGTESSASDASSSVSPSSEAVDVDVTASSESRVDKIRIYRTTDGGGTYLLLDTINNATTTYLDDGSESLGATAAPTDHTIPENLEHIAYHRGYAFGTVGDTLYWSKALEPDFWPATNSTTIPFSGNDTVMGLHSHSDTLLIFGRRNVLVLTGSSGNWRIARLEVELGLTSTNSIEQVGDSLVFLTYNGIYTFPGFNPLVPQIQRELAEISRVDLEDADMVYVRGERALYLAVGGQIYWIHVPTQSVTTFTIDPTFMLSGGEDGWSPPLFAVGSNNYLFEFGGTDDNGADIAFSWKSKVFQLDRPEATKFIRKVGAYASRGAGATVTISITDNENTYSVTPSAVSSGGTSEWDSATWDTSEWSDESLSYFVGALPGQTLRGRTVQVQVSGEVGSASIFAPPISLEYREVMRFMEV